MPASQDIRSAAIIGAGPAGLMAADRLAQAGAHVIVYERMPSAGRKFLMAGRGGLNLTHGENLARFMPRYGASEPHLATAIAAFPPARLRAFSEELGQPTFAGSSGRIFPQAMKASPLLRVWLRRLDAMGVRFAMRHRWTGWRNGALTFDSPGGEVTARPDVTILALGGASWPRLGSDGGWVDILRGADIAVDDLRPANCGFLVAWSDVFRDRFEGAPLKPLALSFAGETMRGEAIVTRSGLEGGGIYALSSILREAIARDGMATMHVDLLPDLAAPEIIARLSSARGKQSLSTFLRKALNLSPAAIGLAQETSAGKLGALAPEAMASLLKAVPVTLTGTAPIARAISTAGGVRFDAIDDEFMLTARPGVFVAGEMLDWEAPTGGYLLQACFATGFAAGESAARWLARAAATPA
jgi:uncharacterized flavoprotein (TIGR03862 family)